MQTSVIIGVLFRLLNTKKTSVQELASRFEVSTRTIFRYLTVLETAGVPIERIAGKNGGISIMDNFRLDRVYFTKDERLRLINSLKVAEPNYGDGLTESVLDKLTALTSPDNDDTYLLMTDTLVIDSSDWNNADTYRHTISAVNEGIFKNRVIKIRYRDRVDELSERYIEPHTLVLKEGVFYLYAYCRMREDFRMFKLPRLIGVQVTENEFQRRKIEGTPWNRPFDKSKSINILIRVKERALPEVEEWLNITPVSLDNGEYSVKAFVPDSDGTIRRLLGFGADVAVLEPSDLREKLISEANKILTEYKKNVF